MTDQDPFRVGLERSLELLALVARNDPALSEEMEQSLRPFFEGPFPEAEPAVSLLNARRHLEWFLLERHSPSLFGVPIERLRDAWQALAEEESLGAEGLVALQQSFTGAFQVTGATESGAWLRDLAGLGDYALGAAPPGIGVG
ncbi:MAG: hypothetical protein O2816_18795, partial [Planctomycetota bacterium]|nr:hypothetical protein [Planctomycetota bacterium]